MDNFQSVWVVVEYEQKCGWTMYQNNLYKKMKLQFFKTNS